MNIENRKKMVLAMEMLVRQINDEAIFVQWLSTGVPDGDVDEFSLDISQVDDYFTTDSNFSDLMDLFLRLMAQAQKHGGLYCDRVSSKEG